MSCAEVPVAVLAQKRRPASGHGCIEVPTLAFRFAHFDCPQVVTNMHAAVPCGAVEYEALDVSGLKDSFSGFMESLYCFSVHGENWICHASVLRISSLADVQSLESLAVS